MEVRMSLNEALASFPTSVYPDTLILSPLPSDSVCQLVERPAYAWPMEPHPPLRYDVASMEHWLDLNA
jgi:hypothetical protein